jgi:L-fuculose-phosphate aldolase
MVDYELTILTRGRPAVTEEQTRNQLTEFARRAYDRGLVGGTGGNFSVRLDGDQMLITASGVSLGDTTNDNLLIVDINTYQWDSVGKFRPSKEFMFHAEIFRRRPDVRAVCHVHPPYATAYAVNKRSIPMVTDAAFKQPPMPRVPFAPSGTEALKDNVAQALENNPDCKVLLLEQHGIIGLGADIVAAYNATDLTEELARIAYLADRVSKGEPIP